MELTEEQAIDRSIDLWKWLAETGGKKEDWPGWSEYDKMTSDCFLCEYDAINRLDPRDQCHACPYYKEYGYKCFTSGKPYGRWEDAVEEGDTDSTIIKAHAKDFLLQLYELKYPAAPVKVKLKEISEELLSRKCAVCIDCGAIYEDVSSIRVPCPNCGEEVGGLYFITLSHSWVGILKR